MKAGSGNLPLIAKVLGMDKSGVAQRIKRDPHLSALYANRHEGQEPTAPTAADAMLRTQADLPTEVAAPDLGNMVEVTEKLLDKGGLLKLGVPESTVKKLRDLRKLQIDAGAFLAVSLQGTHQLYYLQLLALQARADEIYERYLKDEATPMEPMERMFWQRAHTEIVEQLGKGYDRMLGGTQAMILMLKSQKNGAPAPMKSVVGWQTQVPKSVTRAAAKK